MKNIFLFLVFVFAVSNSCVSQSVNFSEIQNNKHTPQSITKKFSDNLFFGGEFSASFGDYSQITVSPSVGYRINNMFSTALKVGYSRAWEKNVNDIDGNSLGYNQFGASATVRFSPVRQAYALLEPAYYSYESPVLKTSVIKTYYDKQRLEVPFVFLGAGFYQQIANTRAGITGELKVDLLRDKNSPYKDWAPFYSIGVVYGF